MADLLSVPPPAETAPTSPRIKRNTACVNCRDSKVKCNSSTSRNASCVRCAKLQLQCVVDRTHKRMSRRSKIEELQQEVLSIKKAVDKTVGPSGLYGRTLPLISSRDGTLSLPQPPSQSLSPSHSLPRDTLPPMQHFDTSLLVPPVLTPSVTTAPTPKLTTYTASDCLAQPRALKSRAFSGEDITFYFGKFFEHFYPYFPIICSRDPDKCYETAPVLFWTIVVTATRRFAKDDTVLPFLTETLPGEIWGAMANLPLPLNTINALLLLCVWPLTSIRFARDPSMVFASIAMSSCIQIGLHTGHGEHPELLGPQFQIRNTDEEAILTWAGFNIISQKISSYAGCPATGQLFNKSIEAVLSRTSPFKIPLHFVTLLECSRFSNRFSKTTWAVLEENRGISHHIIGMFEEEFDKIQRIIYPDISDLDYFTLLSTLQEIQVYYFLPEPDFSAEMFKRNVLKAYSTALVVVRQARKLHDLTGFLSYAPHFVFRTVLVSIGILVNLLLSPYMKDMPIQEKKEIMHEALGIARACSVLDADLPCRATNVIESYWAAHLPNGSVDISVGDVSQHSSRLATNFAFDYIRRWKRAVEGCGTSTAHTNAKRQKNGTPLPSPMDLATTQSEITSLIDWNAFMDDYDWSFMPDYLNES